MSKKLISPIVALLIALAGCDPEEPPPPPVAKTAKRPCRHTMPTYQKWYPDRDGDGYAGYYEVDGEMEFIGSCDREVPGYSRKLRDCDDFRADINPEAEEVWYDGIDQDCDDADDFDADGDGERIPRPEDWVFETETWGNDCNDQWHLTNTSAAEYPDGNDNDCDGEIDENATGRWYCDWDLDGYGSSSIWIRADHPNLIQLLESDAGPCHASSFVANRDDCDDTDSQINPAAKEALNGRDDDCDGKIDEHARRLPGR